MVVSLAELACLDARVWLGTGEKAAARLQIVQSTISRNVRRVVQEFHLDVTHIGKSLQILGDQSFLNQERALHQRFRWEHGLNLRLDAQYYSGPLLLEPAPDGWLLGEFDFMDVATPMQLLRDGILDVWIGVYPDTPEPDDPDFACVHLTRLPTHLVVAKGHPLLASPDPIGLDEIRSYPSLALPDGAFPKVQRRLEQLGLWSSPSRPSRYRMDLWEGRTADQLTVGYATAFTLQLFPTPQVVLPVSIDLAVGDSVIVRRCYADHPRFLALLGLLRQRVSELAETLPELTIVPQA